MARGTPTVVTGPRNAQHYPADPATTEKAAAAGDSGAQQALRASLGNLQREESAQRTADEKFVTFGSRFRGLTLQITSPEDGYNPMTGVRTRARPLKLKFRDYLCQVPKNHPNFEEIMQRVKESPSFGIGLDFWLEADFASAQKEARYKSVVNAIKQDPELYGRLVADMAEGKDFKLPAGPLLPRVKTAMEELNERTKGSLDSMSDEELEAATAPASS